MDSSPSPSDNELFIRDESPASGRPAGDFPSERNSYFHEKFVTALHSMGALDDDGLDSAVESMWAAAEHDRESGTADG